MRDSPGSLAARCEHLGYHSLWSNDEPAASGLETLAHFAAAAPRLELGVGVLPLDRHQPARIATEIDRLGIDPARLWIGIGSGQLRPQIDPLRRAVAELRELLPRGDSHRRGRHATTAVPPRRRGCRRRPPQLDAARPPDRGAPLGAGRSRRGGARHADSSRHTSASPWGSGSLQRLRDEERHYRDINENHRKHFAAMDVPLGSVGVAASTPPQVHEQTGALPVGARPPDRARARRRRRDLADRSRRRRGAVNEPRVRLAHVSNPSAARRVGSCARGCSRARTSTPTPVALMVPDRPTWAIGL